MLKKRLIIFVYGNPRVKKNNQRVVFTGRYPKKINTKAYQKWEQEALPQLQQALFALKSQSLDNIDYPINLQCKFYMQTRQRVDLSALYEGIQDLLVKVGILADDNFNIVASHDGSGVFLDREKPRMEITITNKEVE